jgi:hypothetical protein
MLTSSTERPTDFGGRVGEDADEIGVVEISVFLASDPRNVPLRRGQGSVSTGVSNDTGQAQSPS